jgi:Flp pilus assembly CpaE family ATPase
VAFVVLIDDTEIIIHLLHSISCDRSVWKEVYKELKYAKLNLRNITLVLSKFKGNNSCII